jgi:pyrophosphatase PpaX
MTKRTTVLFDLDGTLIDSTDLIVDSYHHTFRTHGLPVLSREEIIEGIGTPLVAVFGKLSEDADEVARWIATYREYNLSNHDLRIRPFPGVESMIRRLHSGGRPIGVVTSKNHSGARRGLRLIGVEECISVVIGADNVTNHKPHPEPVQRALESLARQPHDAYFIGDSHHDIASGRAAGVCTVAVTWGPIGRERLALHAPDHITDTVEELDLLLA